MSCNTNFTFQVSIWKLCIFNRRQSVVSSENPSYIGKKFLKAGISY
nr:MAG TPA: hypothetical protein [Caudoviricetes sp.]